MTRAKQKEKKIRQNIRKNDEEVYDHQTGQFAMALLGGIQRMPRIYQKSVSFAEVTQRRKSSLVAKKSRKINRGR